MLLLLAPCGSVTPKIQFADVVAAAAAAGVTLLVKMGRRPFAAGAMRDGYVPRLEACTDVYAAAAAAFSCCCCCCCCWWHSVGEDGRRPFAAGAMRECHAPRSKY